MTYTERFHCSILQGFPDPINNSVQDFTGFEIICDKVRTWPMQENKNKLWQPRQTFGSFLLCGEKTVNGILPHLYEVYIVLQDLQRLIIH